MYNLLNVTTCDINTLKSFLILNWYAILLYYYTNRKIYKFNFTMYGSSIPTSCHYKNKSTAFLLEYTLPLVTSKITKTLFAQLEIADTPMLASD